MENALKLADITRLLRDLPDRNPHWDGKFRLYSPGPNVTRAWTEMFPGVEIIEVAQI